MNLTVAINIFKAQKLNKTSAGRYIIEVFGPEYNGKYVLAVASRKSLL